MHNVTRHIARAAFVTILVVLSSQIYGDDKFDNLIKSSKYKEAIKYADENIPASSRDIEIWLKLAEAYEKSNGPQERILFCYQSAQKINPSEPRTFLGLGKCAYKAKKYQEAVKYFQRSFILNRTSGAAEGIAISAAKLKDWDKARDAAETAITLDKNLHEPRLILKEIYRKENDFKSAAEQLEVLVKQKPAALNLWKQLLICYEKLNDKQKIATIDPKIIELDKKNIKSRQRHSKYLLDKKKQDAAFVLLKELALLTPDDAAIFKSLFEIANKKGMKNDAILYLKNFVALDPKNADSHQTLGNLLYEKKDYDGALVSYQKALKLAKNIKGSYQKYVNIVLKKGLKDEAIIAIKGAIVNGEANAKLYIILGDIYKEKKQYVEAGKMYNEALKTETKNIEVLISYGECQAKSNNLTGAIQTLEQVVLLNPKSKKEFKTLGDLKMKLNKKADAIEAYKKYLVQAPSDYKVTKIIGLYEYEKKQYKNTIKYLEMVKDAKLQNEEYLVALGLSYYREKNYKKATGIFSKAREAKVSVSALKKILKPLGQSYEKIGKKQQAAGAYDAYTKIAGVKDAEVYYMKAYLIEDTDKNTAVKMYESNTKLFPNDHRSFLRLGLIYAKDKATLSKSITMLNKAASLGAKDPIIWKKLGMAHGELKNDNSELKAYKKLLTLEPQNLEANRRVGFILLKQKKYTEAITNLEIVSTMAPKDAEILELLADGYMKTKRPAKAVELLSKAKDIKPNKVEIRTKLLEALAAAGKKDMIPKETEQLIELDKKIVSKNKKNVESRVRLSDYLFDRKNYKGAYPIYKELTILLPKEKKSYKRLYEITLKLNKKKESITYLKRYLALDSKNARAHINLAQLLFEQGDRDGALASYRTAFKLDPKMKGVYGQYGDILVKKGLKDEAVKVLNAVIAAGEGDAKTFEVLGGIYQGKKQYASAVKMYKKASDADPKNSKVLSSLSECQAKSGNVSGAILTLEQVVLINPKAKQEYKALGDLQMQVKKKDAAIKTYIKYLEKVPTDEEVSRKVGLNMYGKKKYAEVIKYLEPVKNAKLHTNTFLIALGQSYYKTKKHSKAISLFEKLRKRKISEGVQKEILKPLAECYEKTGYNVKAAEAYLAFTKVPGVRDSEASYKRAFLVEKTDKKKAVTLYQSNIKVFPKDYRNFKRLGLLYALDKPTLSKSAPMLSKASVLKPDDVKILEMLGKIYNKLKNDTKELDTYKKLLKLQPQNLNANRRVGIILLKKKRYKESIVNLEIVSTMEPNNFDLMLSLAECYIETKRHENAITLLEKAKKIKKNDVEIGRLLYKLYKETGKAKKAETEIKALIAITKDNKLRVIYANDLIEQNRLDEASTIVKQVKAADPTNVESLMLLGKVQQAQNKLSEATETYKMISYIKEDYGPAIYERGNIYLKQKKTERAKSMFDRTIKLNPKFGLGYLGLARVAKSLKKNSLYLKHLKKAKTLDPKNKEILAESKKK